jgi:hypothetical protein
VMDLFAFINREIDGLEPVASPVQPSKVLPADAVAVAVACAFSG